MFIFIFACCSFVLIITFWVLGKYEDIDDSLKSEIESTTKLYGAKLCSYEIKLREYYQKIEDQELSDKMKSLLHTFDIFYKAMEKYPEFVSNHSMDSIQNIYLPSLCSIFDKYFFMSEVENFAQKPELEKELLLVITNMESAVKNIMENIFQNVEIDISTDISVINTLLANNGLLDD